MVLLELAKILGLMSNGFQLSFNAKTMQLREVLVFAPDGFEVRFEGCCFGLSVGYCMGGGMQLLRRCCVEIGDVPCSVKGGVN